MNIVENYIFRTVRTAFLAALGVLTAVIWVTQALRQFDLLTTKGQTLVTFLGVTMLTIPSLLAVLAPAAVLIAVLYSLNKLNGDSELIVMSAAGLSPVRLLRPFAVMTALAALLTGAMTIYAMPWTFLQLRNAITNIRADFISHVVREGTFTTLEDGFVFHYRERGPNGELRGILMEDRRDPSQITSYVADNGQSFEMDDNNYLVLTKGNIQRHQPNSQGVTIVTFDRYALDLAQFGSEGSGAPLKPRERSTRELMNLNPTDHYVVMQRGKFRAELTDRFVAPFYTLSFGMIAFAALSQAQTTRQGRGVAMMAAVGAVLLLRILGFWASTLVVKSPAFVALSYLLTLIGLLAGAYYVFGPRFRLVARRREFTVAAATPA